MRLAGTLDSGASATADIDLHDLARGLLKADPTTLQVRLDSFEPACQQSRASVTPGLNGLHRAILASGHNQTVTPEPYLSS
jgi:hypothetical protein